MYRWGHKMTNQKIIFKFIENPKVITLINSNDWDYIYNSTDRELSVNYLWQHPDMEDDIIADFTLMMLDAKIDPLKYLKNVPEAYLRECSTIDYFDIPDHIERIDACAFYYCANLTIVSIPESVKVIEYDAFSECPNLIEIRYGGTMDEWSKIKGATEMNAFSNISENCIIYCTDGELGLE